MYLILIFLPLFGSLSAGLFGKKIGSKGSCVVATSCSLTTFLISLVIFYEVSLCRCPIYIQLTTWINSEVLHVDWGFLFDSLTVVMCCIITSISFVVHLYSTEYMKHDPHLPRFMSYLSLFTFFMLILVTSDNFVQMFVGWEGVGLCSYLLINFWHTRIQANKAAIKAMVINRVGDFGLILGILTIFVNYKAVDYATVFALTPFLVDEKFVFLNMGFNLIDLTGFLLLVGAIGKSAQLGLHSWLPDAMEGPTPVSALIHAATMVTAGIFLIVRCSPIFEYTPAVLKLITVVGACTAFFAATVGLFQNDIKKVIAYSTCSQLGYMFFACGLSNYSIAIFHLMNHAFFKALLFLSAGSIIHAVSDEQDMRKMGGLRNLIPFTYSITVIGSLALIGFPFLTGFYSKDVILEVAYGSYTFQGHLSYFLGSFGAFLTAFYSTRLIYLTFLSGPNGHKSVICFAYDASYVICVSLAVLVVPSIFLGYFTKDLLIGLGTNFWSSSIYTIPNNMNRVDSEFIGQFLKLLPIFLSFFGVFLSFFLYKFNKKFLFKIKMSFLGKIFYNFLNRKWFFDRIYNAYLNQMLLKLSYSVTYKIIDKGVFEVFGPMGLSRVSSGIALLVNNLQSGFLYHYMLLSLVGCTIMLGTRQFWLLLGCYADYRAFIIYIVGGIILTSIKSSTKLKETG